MTKERRSRAWYGKLDVVTTQEAIRPACCRQVQTRNLRIQSYKSWRVNTTASPDGKRVIVANLNYGILFRSLSRP